MKERRADQSRGAARRKSPPIPERGEELEREPVFQVLRSAGNAATVEYVRRIKEGEGFGGSIGAPATTAALHREATKTKPKAKRVVLTEGKDVDALLGASPFLKGYTEEKMKGGTTAEKALKIHDAEDFKKEWLAYALGRDNPATGKTYTQEEAEAQVVRLSAFQIPEKKEIHVHAGRAGQKTWLHESLHLFSDEAGWIDVVRYNLNEGATEFFTKMVCEENNIPFFTNFSPQLASVNKLVEISSKEELADAYFNGRLEGIKKAVDAKGKGKWARWLRCMDRGKYTDAGALLK